MKRCLPSGKSKDLSIVTVTVRSWPPLALHKVSSHKPVAFVFDRLVLHCEHAHAIMCNYRGLHKQIDRKSSLQIICTYKLSSYSGHVSDALGKTK